MNTTQEMTPLQLNSYYRNQVMQANLSLFDSIYHSISTENMELYRALRDAQDALEKVEKEFEKARASALA